MITILDGNTDANNTVWNALLQKAIDSIKEDSGQVKVHCLHDMKLAFCQGCFDCWVKTPGQCIIRDDIDIISQDIMKSNKLIFASPIIRGMLSSQIKKVQDRLIPLVLPHMQLINGESHHRKRYPKYPDLEVWYTGGTYEQRKIVYLMHQRLAINFHSKFHLLKNIDVA